MNEYQRQADTFADHPQEQLVIYPALGLAGEAGEVVDKVKKVLRDQNGKFSEQDKVEIAKEIGDVLWNCAVLAEDIGFRLQDIANMNIRKLEDRKRRGVIHGSGDNR